MDFSRSIVARQQSATGSNHVLGCGVDGRLVGWPIQLLTRCDGGASTHHQTIQALKMEQATNFTVPSTVSKLACPLYRFD